MTTGQFYDHSQRLEDRDVSELIGIARGLVADGEFNEQEADFLVRWLREKEHVTCWPFNILHERVHAMLEKGEINAEDRAELCTILNSLIGEKPVVEQATSLATTLPLTEPVPPVVFDGKTFCFTGKFAFGQRKDCEAAVARLGGKHQSGVTTRLDYLVIGVLGNEDWMHSSFGRKVQQALDFNAKGHHIAIISEDTWAQALCGKE